MASLPPSNFPSWPQLTTLIIVLVVVTSMCTLYGHTTGTILMEKTAGQVTVHDYVHENWPTLEGYAYLYDLPVLAPLIPLLWNMEYKRVVWFAQCAVFAGCLIYLFRCLTTTSTIFTATKKNLPPAQQTAPITLRWQNYIFGHSFDHMFSGHVAILCLLVLCLFGSGIVQSSTCTMLFWLVYIMTYSMFSILSRSHYTVDVLLSFPIAVLVYLASVNPDAIQTMLSPRV